MFERLLDKSIVPTESELVNHCGSSSNLFNKINAFLVDKIGTSKEIKFPYGNNYGWGFAHRKGKKLICNVFAEVNAFTIMIRLSNKEFNEVYNELLQYTKQCIDNKYPCGNGGWIHYRVTCEDQLNDIEKLIEKKGNN